MGFCVYHFEKGKSQANAIGNHIDRKEGKEFSYKNADPNRKHLNRMFIVNDFCKKPLQEAISERIKEGYKGKKAIRKDAVKYLKHVLTGSHEDMISISEDKSKFKTWIEANYHFMAKEFGKDNIVRFTLHMDEFTPHIHCVTVPLTADGKLSAKIVTGDKKALQERQNRYANSMQEFGLKRGLKGSKAKHTTVMDFYKKVNQVDKTSLELPSLEVDELPTIEKPTKTDVLLGKLGEWEERQNHKLMKWKKHTENKLTEEVKKIGNKAVEQIKIKRFKDLSLVQAMKSKRENQNLLKDVKTAVLENNELRELVKDLEVEKEDAKDEGRRQVIAEINQSLKRQKVKLTIDNGEVNFTEIKDKKIQRGR